jgi:hypothetical protein
MVKTHARSFLLVSMAFAAAAFMASPRAEQADHLVVHEWGTFTSVAGPNGQADYWTPLAGPQDLPCFVDHARLEEPARSGQITSNQIGNIAMKGRDIYGLLSLAADGRAAVETAVNGVRNANALVPPAVMPATIRMETPVLYFYSPTGVRVNVKVAFNQGLMSEWYPQATTPGVDRTRALLSTVGTIEWPAVDVRPGADPAFPQDEVKSHYYAARDVDAAPLQVGDQHEKFLFYRGLADFQPTIGARINAAGQVTLTGTGASGRVVLFESRGGQVGYRIADGATTPITVERPALTASVDALRTDLAAMLTAEGLYPREAAAMVETWRDSWFEDGLRVFYVIPKTAVDERLPLSITPAPAEVARVFVGRIELITPEMKDDVERAIVANDLDTLSLYGRFLDSIVLQIADRPAIAGHAAQVASALRAIATAHPAASCR